MKKLFALIIALIFTFSLAACSVNISSGKSGASETSNADNGSKTTASAAENNSQSGSVTIESMKKAAKDAGQGVKDDYPNPWGTWEIVNGFTIIYNDSDQTYVLEHKTQADADADVQTEKDAGYNYAVQNGKFVVTIAGDGHGNAENPDELTFMQNLLNGRPLK